MIGRGSAFLPSILWLIMKKDGLFQIQDKPPHRLSTIAFVPPSHVPRKGSVLPEIYIYPLYPYYYIKYIYINK